MRVVYIILLPTIISHTNPNQPVVRLSTSTSKLLYNNKLKIYRSRYVRTIALNVKEKPFDLKLMKS